MATKLTVLSLASSRSRTRAACRLEQLHAHLSRAARVDGLPVLEAAAAVVERLGGPEWPATPPVLLDVTAAWRSGGDHDRQTRLTASRPDNARFSRRPTAKRLWGRLG